MAKPMPRAPPVTTAVRPLRSIWFIGVDISPQREPQTKIKVDPKNSSSQMQATARKLASRLGHEVLRDEFLIQCHSQTWPIGHTDPAIARLNFFVRQFVAHGR